MTPTQTVLADEIFRRLALGDSLRKICSESWSPSMTMFLGWCERAPEVAEQYARAREAGLDARFEELETLAYESRMAETKGAIAGYKNMIEVRRWQLSKQSPKKYGDKLAVEQSGPDGGPIVTQAIVVPEHDPIAASQAYQQFVDPK